MGKRHMKRKETNNCAQLLTEAAQKKQHLSAWQSYPRPQMKRERYLLLKEDWTLNERKIRVPFVPQSVLSEYVGTIGEELTYQNTFRVPDSFTRERILLHFGAVDQIAEVWLNDCLLGTHEGGYLSFSFDITAYVKKDDENHLLVKVTDTLNRDYPYGKQCKKRGGMWYTPTSGIWQNVWIENVPDVYVSQLKLTPDLEGVFVELKTCQSDSKNREISDEMYENTGKGNTWNQMVCVEIMLHTGETMTRTLNSEGGYISLTDVICQDGTAYQPQLWTTETPYLYQMKIHIGTDEIETYFALRTTDIREIKGVRRVCLNGKPVFWHGVLDQGYYSDGIFLPAEEAEYERDILRMKELGFNMLRKHIKIEPEIFYYYCDKHGMLVMQDLVNNGSYSFLRDTALPTIGFKKRKDVGKGTQKQREVFIAHAEETVRQLYNHPCIVAYTIFNEGWGQFDSDKMYDKLKSWDDTRLIDTTSGWFWQKQSDFDSEHIYFKTKVLQPITRPLFVSECGGFSLEVAEHLYNKQKSYGYGKMESEKELTDAIEEVYTQMILPAISQGVCGGIYTQLSDVEDEINGLYTYDRVVCKVEKNRMKQLAQKLLKAIEEADVN
ncbi:MAG: glycoside hydrolase family 2 [Eubacterium sp.]|nr:glycoside hydrolase family 2 [Eubacterium sp.]